MPPSEKHFGIREIFKFFTKEEVKTPLAFFFKVVPYMTAAWFALLYAPGLDSSTKIWMMKFSALVFGALCLLVAVFALFWPRKLVYGESGYRAERRMEFGTEKRVITREEADLLPGTEDIKKITSGDK